MSHATYNKLWDGAQEILDNVTRLDVEQQSAKPTKDRNYARRVVAELYAKYILAVNKLDQCYDQIVQPQKRILIKQLLETSIGRFLELKHELVNIDLSEFSYFDDVLSEQGLLPNQVEVNVPTYYRRERLAEIKERRQTMENILRSLGFYEDEVTGIVMTEVRAVLLVQVHERARQGRLRARFMKEIRQLKDKVKTEGRDERKLEEWSKQAALNIQRVWRGYITRRKIRRRVLEEMILIGMLRGSQTAMEQRERAEEVKALRRAKQDAYQINYLRDLELYTHKIRKERGDVMMERMADEVRAWYLAYRGQTGKFPDLPSEETGGSALIFSRQGADSEHGSKSTAPSSKESRGKKDKGKKGKEKEEAKKKKEEDEEDLGFKMGPSNFLAEAMVAGTEYQEVWRTMDESSNPNQVHYVEMIEREKTQEVEAELRKIVDNQLRGELEALQAALDRDRARKKTKKAAKKKGRRGGKKAKKKKEKDLTPDRTTESLFEELVTNGIIKKQPEVPLSAFIGERSYANHELRQQGKDPLPGIGDIRQVILEYCIMPLGSKNVHLQAPLVRSVLIAGPKGSGKRLLVNAVCTETGAVLFDLTASNIVGKYPGKAGLVMLVHLVSKVSRLLQPSVIFIDGAEKTFMKKVPKTDKTDPKRLKKDLPKLVKQIGPEDQFQEKQYEAFREAAAGHFIPTKLVEILDEAIAVSMVKDLRILVIGTSRCPWECDQKLLCQAYHKMVLIPRPDYGTRSLLWSEQLLQYSGLSREFNTSSLATLSDGYTVGSILSALKEVLTCKRILQLRVHQLTHGEIINVLAKYEPVYREEEEAFLQWYSKTPIGRRKTRALELEAEALTMKESMKKK